MVGAGQAGRWLALTLRAEGFGGRIVWFGDEDQRPYERPPLSKAVLKGEAGLEQLALIAQDKWAELQLDWHPGTAVSS
ncbi:MAG TPA: FAD-dependent oxidoreductase, partial [Rubrivivax sp.]|nr:FAD-dependent oxidoreductase [Rubrivivax sp.]